MFVLHSARYLFTIQMFSQRCNLKTPYSCREWTAYSLCLKQICVILVNEIIVHTHLISTLSYRIKLFNYVEGAKGTSLCTYLVSNITKESWNLVSLLLILFIENSLIICKIQQVQSVENVVYMDKMIIYRDFYFEKLKWRSQLEYEDLGRKQ